MGEFTIYDSRFTIEKCPLGFRIRQIINLQSKIMTGRALAEQSLGALEKALALRTFLAVAKIGELLKLRLLCGGKLRRHFHVNPDVQITVAIALKILHTLAFEAEQCARLRAGGNFDERLAVERGHFDLRAERGLNKTHRHFAKQIVAVTLEDFVGFDVQHNIQISRRSAAQSSRTVAGGTQARARVHARRNAEFDAGGFFAPTAPVTAFARMLHDPARALTLRTGLRDAKNPARADDLAATVTGRASLGL